MDTRVFWDERYGSRDQLFSGAPNGALVTEVADLPPGQALDVGCGEGADALWLAQRGWRVTAVDISRVALRRAAAAATDVAGRVAWLCGDLTTTPPPAGAFDLVNVQYFPLPRQPHHAALRRLLDAVAPGGTLLFVGHAPADLPHQDGNGSTSDDYDQPGDVARLLDDGWVVQVDETRPRTNPTVTPHTHDTVLRARRLRAEEHR
ncbi:Methyltransferase domain-containing protein [Amycolatopsis arida]|uniref:Methyltransferase domain-containing protein n=1 Tax=Amycolatopsis arida TaxID=587909 RepID=A0A1I5P848_9PSEU|nr:class I SAM-dependent methyltransferase [Amycolatopsis arida]TDX98395.1 methyltransferase family protein [Amycolatopsis arida]SFP30127.1 Methyltransferase domain-containing protein [Amycolatopsis arida]